MWAGARPACKGWGGGGDFQTAGPPPVTPLGRLSTLPPNHANQTPPRLCRALFERATHLQLPAKKMKFLFKRWLDFEKARGDEQRVAHVKRRAAEFVESVAASA